MGYGPKGRRESDTTEVTWQAGRQHKCIPSQLWKLRGMKSRCQQGCVPSEGCREGSFLSSSSFWWPQDSLPCGNRTPSLSPSPHGGLLYFSLGQEDPLEKEMASHSSVLVWEIPWTEEPGGLWSMGLQGDGHN